MMAWTKVKIPLLETLKWLSVVLVVLFLSAMLAQGKESQTEFSVMSEAVTAAADLTPMQQADNQMIKRLYGLDPADYDGLLLYYPTTNMGAEELLLVKLKDTAQQETVAAAIAARLATQKSSFDGYGVDQYAMLEKSVTELQGNYVLLIVAADTAPVRQAFLGAF